MPRGELRPAVVPTQAGEFAPGIPQARKIEPIPRVARVKPQEWGMATQLHEAERAGRHVDLRLVDPAGKAHSWALPKAELPKPGEKLRVIQQPTHTAEYAAKKGPFLLPAGYGKGKVTGSGVSPVEIVSKRPGVLRFNVYRGRGAEEYAIVDTPKGQLLHNFTVTKDTGVRGAGGHEIPQSKPKYREQRPEAIRFDDDGEVHQAKLDGAHVTFHLPGGGRQIRAFSYRPTERETGVLEHTHKLPGYRALRAPESLAGTVLRGELWAADKGGRALPAERIGGMLNASVPQSRLLQARHGELRAAPFDVVRYKGRDVENAPYAEKMRILKEVERKVPFLKPPPTATTAKEKERLFGKIQAGRLKETKEGVVTWPLAGGRPTKIKLRPDVDAEVVGVFPGKGKHEGRAGGLLVRASPGAPVTRVGTGFSDRQREQLWRDQDQVVGRVAKVETQQVFPSGRLRAPSFKEFHIEKGKQASAEPNWQFGFLDEIAKLAALFHGSPRRSNILQPRGEHGDPRVPPVVFASPSETFALAYAGRKWGDRDIEQIVRGGPHGRMILREMRPGALQDVYGKKRGYLYEVPEDQFRALSGRRTAKEVVSREPVRPIQTRVIPNVLSALKRMPDVELRPYDPDAPETKAAVRRQVERMREMDDGGKEYLRWRLAPAPTEVRRMFREEMRSRNG